MALTGDEDAPDGTDALQLLVAAPALGDAAADHDPELAGLAARLTELAHLVTDVAGELASYLASVDADPARLATAQERLAALTALVRRHAADDVDGVLAWAARASDRLLELDGADDRIAALEQQDAELETSLGRLAAELSAARAAAALRFGAGRDRRAGRAGDAARPGDRGRGAEGRRRRPARRRTGAWPPAPTASTRSSSARPAPGRTAPGAAEGRLRRRASRVISRPAASAALNLITSPVLAEVALPAPAVTRTCSRPNGAPAQVVEAASFWLSPE